MVSSIFQWAKKNDKILLYVVVFLLIAFTVMQCNGRRNAENEALRIENKYIQNVKVLNDSVRTGFDQLGNRYSQKLSYMVDDLQELKLLNSTLAQKVSQIKGTKALVETRVIYMQDTTKLNTHAQLLDSVLNLQWNYTYSDKGLQQVISGYTPVYGDKEHLIGVTSGQTVLTSNKISLDLDVGVKQTEDSTQFYVKSLSDKIEIGEINGVTMFANDPQRYKERRMFSMGPQLGGMYNFSSNGVVPYLGVGVQWNAINFGPKIQKKK